MKLALSWMRVLVNSFLLPAFKGAIVGFLVVVVLLRVFTEHQMVLDTGFEGTASVSASPIDIALLIYDPTIGEAVGLWQWVPAGDPEPCIASLDFLVSPPGKPLGELISEAIQSGDSQWIARHVRNIQTSCTMVGDNQETQVLLLQREGLISLVDLLNGLAVDDTEMTGEQIWDFLANPTAGNETDMFKQWMVWSALASKASAESFVNLTETEPLFWIDPAVGDALSAIQQIFSVPPPIPTNSQ